MVPPLVTASRWAPGRPVRVPVTRSQTMRGPQLGELVGGVAAAEQVEGGVVRAAGEVRERRAALHQLVEVVDGPGVEGGGGDDLLGEHVERVGRHAQRLDRAGAHPLDGDRGLGEVAAVLGEQHAARDLADLVAGAADALERAGDADGGHSIWTTRSTAPMSMPSSRLLVATTQGSRPRLRSSSISARCSLDTEPWWALAITCSAPWLCAGLRHHLGAGSARWRACSRPARAGRWRSR